MGKTAVGRQHRSKTDRMCPQDKALMQQITAGEAVLDLCRKCGGQFFDTGEMFAAFGMKADPSYWDRPETGGAVKDGHRHCPECETHMLVQNVAYAGDAVEIDRCGHCGGIWLDKNEMEKIMSISEKLGPALEAERKKAQEELDKMGEPDFTPGLIAKFVKMFKR
jgi:Zn-finger nucleic acid-binding protein